MTKLEVRGPRLAASIVRSGSNKEGMSLVGIGVGVGGLVMDCGNFLCNKYQLGACACACACRACRACGVVWCGVAWRGVVWCGVVQDPLSSLEVPGQYY